jgi:Uma2 family endonuclease
MAHSVRYPDLMVVCSAIDPNASEVTDPVVVMEVLSDGTSAQDRIVKNQEYRDTPSIQHYAILEQDRVAATVFARAGSDWTGQLLVGRDAVLVFREIDVEIPLAEFYEGMEIEASTP